MKYSKPLVSAGCADRSDTGSLARTLPFQNARMVVDEMRALRLSSPDGDRHDAAKVLKGFGGAPGCWRWWKAGGTYRAVYTVKFAEAVFVLHCFQKKSKRGVATPKEDMDIVHARLRVTEAFAKELRNEKKTH